jgi:hypothetical protein
VHTSSFSSSFDFDSLSEIVNRLLAEWAHCAFAIQERMPLSLPRRVLANIPSPKCSVLDTMSVSPLRSSHPDSTHTMLALPFRVVDMASAQSGSTLSGSESFGSNSEPGLLFELLAYQPLANPVIVLDELDKAGGIIGGAGLARHHNAHWFTAQAGISIKCPTCASEA